MLGNRVALLWLSFLFFSCDVEDPTQGPVDAERMLSHLSQLSQFLLCSVVLMTLSVFFRLIFYPLSLCP